MQSDDYVAYQEALERVRQMNRDELLAHIKQLYGTGELQRKFGWPTDEEIRAEALRQTRKEWESVLRR